MSEDFKKKLRAYTEGKLSQEEKAEVERELERLEQYQAFLEDELTNEGSSIQNSSDCVDGLADNKELRIIKRAKWKARIHNAVTALAIIFIGSFLCGVFTSIYFASADPSRVSVYRDVVQSTIAVTEPNVRLRGGGMNVNPFFNMDLKGELQKRIGSAEVNAGEIEVNFLLNQASFPQRKKLIDNVQSWPFRYPESTNPMDSEWAKLEKLPEGTVAEAYLSLDQFYSTDEVLKKFMDKDMRLLWFAVDTGFDDVAAQERASFIGFPYEPLWHHDDWTVTRRTENKQGLFGKSVSQSATSPELEEYGSAELRNENFIKTLELLKRYDKIANRIAVEGDLRITARLEYLKIHGINIYGVVVTGPTKEILKLKKEPWAAGIHLGEVRLWNWEQ